MKKTIIISSAIILSLTGGILYMNQPKDEPVKQSVSNVEVQEPKTVPTTAPEAPQQVIESNVSNEPIAETPVAIEPIDGEKLWTDVFIRIQSYNFTSSYLQGKAPQMAGAISASITSNPGLLTNSSLDSLINRCIAYYESMTSQNDVSIALSKSDCGF